MSELEQDAVEKAFAEVEPPVKRKRGRPSKKEAEAPVPNPFRPETALPPPGWESEPSILIRFGGDRMVHPTITFTGMVDYHQINAVSANLSRAYARHLHESRQYMAKKRAAKQKERSQ